MILSYNAQLHNAEQSNSSSESVEDEEFDHIEHLMEMKKSNLPSSRQKSSKPSEHQALKLTSDEIESEEIVDRVLNKAWKLPNVKPSKLTNQKAVYTSSTTNNKTTGSKHSSSRCQDRIQNEILRIIGDDSQRKIQKDETGPSSMTLGEQPTFLEDSLFESSSFKSSFNVKGKNFVLKSFFATTNANSENDSQSGNSGVSPNKTNEFNVSNNSNSFTPNSNNGNNLLQNYYTPKSRVSEELMKYNKSYWNLTTNMNNDEVENPKAMPGNSLEYAKCKYKKYDKYWKECEVHILQQSDDDDVNSVSKTSTNNLIRLGSDTVNEVCQGINTQLSMDLNGEWIHNVWKENYQKHRKEWHEDSCEESACKTCFKNQITNASINVEPRSHYLSNMVQNCLVLAKEQWGCRMLQNEIDKNPVHNSALLFEQIKDNFNEWSCHLFGNYFMQKIIQHLPESTLQDIIQVFIQKKHNFNAMSSDQYGTRVIQSIIASSKNSEILIQEITSWIRPNVTSFIQDQNACHVISAYVTHIPFPTNDFIYSFLVSNIFEIATHKYSCLILQKAIQSATPQQSQTWLFAISQSSYKMFNNQYGNYALQSTISLCNYHINHTIVLNLLMNFQKFSSMKYSSSIIEKCMQCSNKETLDLIFERWCNDYSLTQGMLFDCYGNYVIQRAWSLAVEPYKNRLIEIIGQNIIYLRPLPFGSKLYSKWIRTYPEWLLYAHAGNAFEIGVNNGKITNNSLNMKGSTGVSISSNLNNNNKNIKTNINNVNNNKQSLNPVPSGSSDNSIHIEQLNNYNNVYIGNGVLPNTHNYNSNWENSNSDYNVQRTNQNNRIMPVNNNYCQGANAVNSSNKWVFLYNNNNLYSNPNYEIN